MKKLFVISDKKGLMTGVRKFIILCFCAFTGMCLIIYPEKAKDAINYALSVCGDTVIASLFPFLFLSAFIGESDILKSESRAVSFLSNKLFKMPFEGVCAFISGAVGGFPVGANMACSLLENGALGRESAKRLIFSCVCPSPAFAVTAVGVSLFSSSKTGLIIYSSVILSNLILFFISRSFFGEDEQPTTQPHKITRKFSSAFVSAGRKASEAMISICSYILIFSCLCEMMKSFTDNDTLISSVCAFFEVTTGCERLSSLCNFPLIAGVIGWGGLSVHFQIMEYAEKAGLSLRLLFTSRAACAFLSVLICDILLRLFPSVTQTAVIRSDLVLRGSQTSLPISFMMLLTCFVFLIGDCTFKIRKGKT